MQITDRLSGEILGLSYDTIGYYAKIPHLCVTIQINRRHDYDNIDTAYYKPRYFTFAY